MDDWYSFKPSGYKPSSIIGRTWIWGAADCWTIVVDYFKDRNIPKRTIYNYCLEKKNEG